MCVIYKLYNILVLTISDAIYNISCSQRIILHYCRSEMKTKKSQYSSRHCVGLFNVTPKCKPPVRYLQQNEIRTNIFSAIAFQQISGKNKMAMNLAFVFNLEFLVSPLMNKINTQNISCMRS